MATIQEAVRNIATVISGTRMTDPEHTELKQNIQLVVQRCQLADKLEKENSEKETVKNGKKKSKKGKK